MQYEVEVNGRPRQVHVHRVDGRFVVTADGREWSVEAVHVDSHTLSLLIEEASRNYSFEVTLAPDPASGGLIVRVGGTPLSVSINGRRRWGRRDEAVQTGTVLTGPQRIVAPMPGKVVRVLVKKGEAVQARQSVVVIEAMKMENELRAENDGTMAEVHVQDGQSVEAGALLAVILR